MAIRFTGSGGNDSNDGLDNIGVSLATATWTESSFTLTQAAHGYTFAAGDVLYVSGGTGVTVGLYEVVSSTANDIVLRETSTLRDVLNASDFAAGDLASADITSASGHLLTGDAAMNAVSAGDIVYMRNDKGYTELLTIDTAGTTTASIRFQGYQTTLDDGIRCIITGNDSRANCVVDSLGGVGGYYIFQNIIFTDATSNCVNVSLNQLTFKNCHFTNSNLDGVNTTGNGIHAESCLFSNLAGKGIDAGTACNIIGCKFLSCTLDGIEITHGNVLDCIFSDIGDVAIQFLGSNGFACVVDNCTIDGNSKTTGTGVEFPISFWGAFVLTNTIIYDCSIGVSGHLNGGQGRLMSRNNLLNSNTTDYDNTSYETFIGEVTDAPGFTNEVGLGYTLTGGSAAVAVGFDAHVIDLSVQGVDLGALQTSSAGGGGLLMPNKRGGKQ